ncbi:uncharacterized protein [Watersipora subatra]|uniref:uncharacterized protein n=1 Tax=Watersipora subatra TaxID=2589382 RepID=UPI00355B9BE8
MAAMKNRQTPADTTHVLLQKNDRIRERHTKEILRIRSEEKRSDEDLAKQIEDLQREIRDIHAYTMVYRENSLVCIDERRSRPDYSCQEPPIEPCKTSNTTKKNNIAKLLPSTTNSDPFRVRNCLLDVDFKHKETMHRVAPTVTVPAVAIRKKSRTRASTAGTNLSRGSKEYQSLLPGNCTSYYSIRKFYEDEKKKLLCKWSPEERRRKTVQWILRNNAIPQFSSLRRATTSAIFRDFGKAHGDVDLSTQQLSLPAIASRFQG